MEKTLPQADLLWSALPFLRVSVILDRVLVVSKEKRKQEGVYLKEKKNLAGLL